MIFSFENSEVYKKSLLFVDQIDSLIGIIPDRMHRVLFDQISRSALSIPLKIAEANARPNPAEKRHFLLMARGSAYECVPLLEIMRQRELIKDKDAKFTKDCLIELANKIYGLIQSTEQSERDQKQ